MRRLAPRVPAALVALATLLVVGMPWRGHAGAARQLVSLAGPAQAGIGYLLDFAMLEGNVRLNAVADIDNYQSRAAVGDDDDWAVLIVNDAGQTIGRQALRHPGRAVPHTLADQPLPFTVIIPRLEGMARVIVVDEGQRERVRVPIDDAFRAAAAESRAVFLAASLANQRGLAARAGGVVGRRPPVDRPLETPAPPLADLGMELARDVEALAEAGPAPPVSQVLRPRRPTQIEAQPITQAGAFTMSGVVTDAATGLPIGGATVYAYQYNDASQFVRFSSVTTDGTGHYSVGVDSGRVDVWGPILAGPIQYVFLGRSTPIAGDLTFNITGYRSVTLSGQFTSTQGTTIAGATIAIGVPGYQAISVQTNASGQYSIAVPGSMPLSVTITTPLPYFAPAAVTGLTLTSNTTRDYVVERGAVLSGRVLGDSGAGLQGASVLVRLLTETAATPRTWSTGSDSSGNYTLLLPGNLFPGEVVIAAFKTGYVLGTSTATVAHDVTNVLQLARGFTLSGTVRDTTGDVVPYARVRAYQGATFFYSAGTNASGEYAMTVPAATYTLEAWPRSYGVDTGLDLMPATVEGVTVSASRVQNVTVPRGGGSVRVRVLTPFGWDSDLVSRIDVRSGGRLVRSILRSHITATYLQDPATLLNAAELELRLPSGEYELVVHALGYPPTSLGSVIVPGAALVRWLMPAPYLWTGTLRNAAGAPLAGASIWTYGDTTDGRRLVVTGASGGFSVPITPNGLVKFNAPPGTRDILRTERLGELTQGRTADVTLESLPAFTDTGAPLTQMFGTADRTNRWNIVMIGDGYTSIAESYSDTNQNGRWDGVLFYDLNASGAWETGEPYQRYGVATAPIDGTNPSVGNEPFTDLNGDGAPNFNDQVQFDRNTEDTLRSMFGQDFWRDHRDAFNVFRLRVVSNQAGHDLRGAGGVTILSRDTALGTFLNAPSNGWMFNADNALVSQYLNQYVPEVNTRIVVVNQPVLMGRVTGYMFQYGGTVDMSNNSVVAHEMGHAIGSLADEYPEVEETYVGNDLTAANITAVADPQSVPWARLLTSGIEIPSVPLGAGIGLFENAGQYTGGKYRPTTTCMMTGGERMCPVCTRALEARLNEVAGVIGAPVPVAPMSTTVPTSRPTFSWQALGGVTHYLFELERSSDGRQMASLDVYQTTLPLAFSLSGAGYRWRIKPASSSRSGDWSAWVSFVVDAPVFTDDPLVAATTAVKAVHLTELRQAIDQLRARVGLGGATWTDASITPGQTMIKAVHLTELRSALAAVYVQSGMAVPVYTRSALNVGATPVAVVDVAELRAAIYAIW